MAFFDDSNISSVYSSVDRINSLKFVNRSVISRAATGEQDYYEILSIRQAEPHEAGLFQKVGSGVEGEGVSGGDTGASERVIVGKEGSYRIWPVTKRLGPARKAAPEPPTPLKRYMSGKGASTNRGGVDAIEVERCLNAAGRLLDVYPMPRSREHIELLMQQYEGITQAVEDLEEALLQTPLPPASQDASSKPLTDAFDSDPDSLESQLRKEELEILALQDLKDERETELRKLETRLKDRKAAMKREQMVGYGKKNDEPPVLEETTNADKGNLVAEPSKPRRAPTVQRSPPVRPESKGRPPVKQSPVKASKSVSSPRHRPSPSTSSISSSSPSTPKKKVAVAAMEVEVTPRAHIGGGGVGEGESSTKEGETATAEGDDGFGSPLVSEDEVDRVVGKIWAGIGDLLRPFVMVEDSMDEPLERMNVKETLGVLTSIISLSSPEVPPSPHSITSIPSTITLANQQTQPPPPSIMMELHLLTLQLTSLFSLSPPLPTSTSPLSPEDEKELSTPLPLIIRDSLLVKDEKEGMISVEKLKARLGKIAGLNGWSEALATKALYSLVGKRVVRIDRRGKEAVFGCA